ncbi:hypothetical protein [Olleya sp. Bg11-27]|uniref:hypothetical protein n=1 Tax=Olleya sp. Bg11-27 TaxID=2058135 RepID=UPI000C30BAA9|nr:hypothetical protein [Olleya sp. Bg11-27]AUC75859.1 hypothetical protein CW732_09280 [Olleya sp. Bg11-27]
MKTIHVLFILLIGSLTSCNNSSLKNQIIFQNKPNELIILTFINDDMYHLDLILAGTKKNQEATDVKNSENLLDGFGLIQFEGEISTSGEQLFLSDIVISNSIKWSNGKEIKAPIDSSITIIYSKDTEQLNFGTELYIENTNYLIKNALKLIDKHKNWNREKIKLEYIKK